jgi:hypothetical protein
MHGLTFLQDLFDAVPDGLNPNVTGWLVYDDAKPTPAAKFLDSWDDFDDATLVPSDGEKRYASPDMTITLNVMMVSTSHDCLVEHNANDELVEQLGRWR